jgi:hypothetical protein
MTDTPIVPVLIPPPRAVRQLGKGSRTAILRLLMLPHAIVGIGTLIYTLFLISLVVFSVPRKGEVTGKAMRVDDRDSTYLIRFSYTLDGKRYEQSTAVSQEEFASIREGEEATVQVHPWFPGMGPYLASQDRSGQVIMMTGFSLFWNGILGTFVWMMIIKPARRRSLVTHGKAVMGTITRKEVFTRGAGGTALVSYAYAVPGDTVRPAQEYTGRMEVQPVESEGLTEGEQVLVMYDRDAPARSLLYVLSGYEIVTRAER